VREVIDLDPGRIERPPQIGSRIDDSLIDGIAEKGGEFIVILDIDEAFKAEAAGERGAEAK
jgi:chemotaxis signal transduction protein